MNRFGRCALNACPHDVGLRPSAQPTAYYRFQRIVVSRAARKRRLRAESAAVIAKRNGT